MSSVERRRKKIEQRKRARKRLVIFLLAIALLIALAVSPLCNVRRVEVTGNDRVSTEDVLTAAGNVEGINLFRVNKKAIRESVGAVPYVRNVKVKRVLPSTLRIIIEESGVVAYIPFGGQMVCVNQEGKVIDVVDEAVAINAPIVKGITLADYKIGAELEPDSPAKLETLMKYVEYFRSADLLHKITELNLSDINHITFVMNYKLRVQFGSDDQISYKMKFLKQVITEVGEQTEGEINMLSMDNVTFKEGPPETPRPSKAPEAEENTEESEEEEESEPESEEESDEEENLE